MKKNNVIYTILVVIATAIVTTAGLMMSGFMLKVPYSDLKYYRELSSIANQLERTYYKGVDKKKMFQGAYRGMVDSLGDEYSEYFDGSEAKDFLMLTQNRYTGIGVIFGIGEDEKALIMNVFDESPAKKAGVEPGDIVVSANGEKMTKDNMTAITAKIKSKKGQDVRLVVNRNGKELTFDMKTDDIKVKSVAYDMLDKNIGYIAISGFSEDTSDEFESALTDLKKKGIKALAIDLRGNGGGLVNESVKMADDLLGDATILTQVYKDGRKEVIKSDSKKMLDLPIAILTDKNTASASEIFTGALVDNEAAVSIGEKTYGKGVTQSIGKLANGDMVKITVSEYLTPSGKHINKKGIEPTYKVKDQDELRKKTIDYLNGEINKDKED